jgi:cell division protein FtsW (lipid II flippase)
MDQATHEQYEYARRRIKQKKRLYFHFVLFSLTSIFLFVAHRFFNVDLETNWCLWLITFWAFLFVLHFIKVFITDRFMDKNWERDQIDRLVALQHKKISQLEKQIEKELK